MRQSWSVAATVDEPAALVLAFALHHLEIGADEVHIFLDRPNPEAEEALRAIPEVRLTLCDDAHWKACARRKRPPYLPGRQKVNAGIAYDRTRTVWLLHADCDEFVSDGPAMTDELDQVLPQQVYLRLQVAERAYLGPQSADLFEGVFRHPLRDFDYLGPLIYGDFASYLKDGVTGHRAGKAVVRTGLPIEMGVHSPGGLPPPPHRNAETRLLHFDGLTPLHFLVKLLSRAVEPDGPATARHTHARRAQIEKVRGLTDDPVVALAFVDRLMSLNQGQLAKLKGVPALDLAPFHPKGANPLAKELNTLAFDRSLLHRHRDFIQSHAPKFGSLFPGQSGAA